VAELLSADHRVELFFYNPNIYPETEYELRLSEVKQVAGEYGYPCRAPAYDHAAWLERIRGLENEPEKGRRCDICYRHRLEQTARSAREAGFAAFASTLSVSPHKKADKLSELGRKLGREYGIDFLDRDFKKQDGAKKAARLSRELGLYRQDYCGCEFSR